MTTAPARSSPAALAQLLGVPVDAELLGHALTHRSYAYENGGLPTNERLEFLGDSVLGLVVTDRLFREHPDLSEGQLAKLRAAVVNMRALAEVGRALGLGTYVRLGRGEEATGGRDKDSILADTVEAVIGAVYVDLGMDAARAFVLGLVSELIAGAALLGAGLDWKTSLQELTAELQQGVPEYVVSERGPDHAKTFTAAVLVVGEEEGRGSGRSKKEAEQRAAEAAWSVLSARRSVEQVVDPSLAPAAEPDLAPDHELGAEPGAESGAAPEAAPGAAGVAGAAGTAAD